MPPPPKPKASVGMMADAGIFANWGKRQLQNGATGSMDTVFTSSSPQWSTLQKKPTHVKFGIEIMDFMTRSMVVGKDDALPLLFLSKEEFLKITSSQEATKATEWLPRLGAAHRGALVVGRNSDQDIQMQLLVIRTAPEASLADSPGFWIGVVGALALAGAIAVVAYKKGEGSL